MEWFLSPEYGRFSLSLLAEGLGKESMSTSTPALDSTMAGSSKQAHSTVTNSGNDELSPTQNLIINALGITRGLTLHEKGDICVAYAKYVEVKKTIRQLNQMKKAGTWTAKLPTLQEISGIFVSKSTFFNNHHRVFPNVPLYPVMERWLLNKEDVPEDVTVWGGARPTFGKLDKILKSHGAPSASGKKGGKKKKGSPSGSEEEVVKGKGKGKAKEKGKGKKEKKDSDSE